MRKIALLTLLLLMVGCSKDTKEVVNQILPPPVPRPPIVCRDVTGEGPPLTFDNLTPKIRKEYHICGGPHDCHYNCDGPRR